jgi:LysM repeat protein
MSKILLSFSLLLAFGSHLLSGQTYQTHRVSYGETLYGIAKEYGISVETLQNANYLRGSSIYPGNELLIPMQGEDPSANQRVMTQERANLRVLEADPATSQPSYDRSTYRSTYQPSSYQANLRSPNLARQAEDVWVRTNRDLVGNLRPTGNLATRDRSNGGRPTDQISDQNQPTTRSDDNKRYGAADTDSLRAEPQGQRIYHRVSRDEDIYDVAEQYGLNVETIQRWNDTKSVYTGQVLVIYRDEQGAIIDPDETPLDRIESQLQGSSGKQTRSGDPFDPDPTLRVGSDAAADKPQTETGTFEVFEWPDTQEAYYLAHKRLKPGSQVKAAIPGTDGSLSVKVVAYQNRNSRADYSLSAPLARLLESAGAKGKVTLILSE